MIEYPLSPNQQGLWALEQRFPEQGLYNANLAWRLPADISPIALRRAVERLTERHPAWRTTFSKRDGVPFQIVHEDFPIDFREITIEDSDPADLEKILDIQASQHPIDLEQGPPVRWVLVSIRGQQPILLLIDHHIISDVWSNVTAITELGKLYREETGGPPANLSLPKESYSRFIQEKTDWLESPDGEREKLFWQEQLSGQLPLLNLPTDRPRSANPSFRTECLSFAIPVALQEGMRKLAKGAGVRPLALWLSAWFVFLHRFTGQEDLVTTIPVAGRGQEYDGILGFFANTVPIRVRCSGEEAFRTFVKHAAEALEAALAHREWPFPLMLTGTDRSTLSALSQTSFPWQNYNRLGRRDSPLVTTSGDLGEIWHVGDMTWELIQPWRQPQETDILLCLMNLPDNQYGFWRYASDLFDRSTIERWSGHFVRLLEGIVAEPETQISQLPLLTEAERRRILVEWNDTGVPYPQDKCVHELFEAQVVKTPDAVAVIFSTSGSDEEVSYGELNARANRLAHRLRKLGVGEETLVGLFVERSVEMVVGILAILKAGGAYVPLNPEYPSERLIFMAEDADLKVLLCHESTRERLPECAARILDVDAESATIAVENSENPAQLAEPNNLAYVMYTSGSTGKPKGVCVEHGNIVRLVRNTNYVALDEHQVFLQAAPISFDAATFELWGSLLNGARLVVPSPGQLSLEELGNYLRRHNVTILWLTAGLFSLMVEHRPDDLTGLRQLLAGGDVLLPEHVAKALRVLENGTLINGYGPTENTTFTTCHVIPPDVDAAHSIPIGVPISNTQVYILDAHMNPVPVGVPGELYAGGAGVARGYLNRPELTFDKFIPDPFSDEPKARMYRTGDLCRWLPDGNIEFLGRIDTQVKIRGFRIECGEVENALLAHPDVREVVVDARGEGAEKQLVAWLSAARGNDADVVAIHVGAIHVRAIHESPLRDELCAHLRASLPDWMIPARFVFVDTLPLTPSGKIDRRALPAPETSDSPGTEYVAPISPTEELLAGLWSTVLKREPIGRLDNFFDLGGHSLLATQLISRIRDSFDLELPVRVVFEHPLLSALAGAISSSMQSIPGPSARDGNKQTLPPIEPQPANTPKSLSFAQQRLWFLDRYEGGNSATYNIPVAVRLSGALDIDALRASLQWTVGRHKSLRTVFPDTEGEVNVSILPLSAFEFPIHDLRHPAPAGQQLQQRIDEHATRPFDLAKGPLFRAEILQLTEEDGQAVHVLLINMHHIISDGWSLGVFVDEWRHAYVAFAGGYRPTLPPLPVQYSDYAHWQRQWLQGEILEQQSDYWREALSGIPELLALPTDYPRPARQDYRGNHYRQSLPAGITAALKNFSREQGVTLFMTLLAAFDVLLARYSGQDDICVGSPIANRTHTHTENLIGFFVNTLVLRTRLNPDQGFRDLLQQVRQTCINAYAHQDIPFETLVEQQGPTRSLGHSPLFQVMLVLQNNAPVEMELPGLTITTLEQAYPIAKFDLTLFVEKQDDQLCFTWEYATSLFTERTIRCMGEHFEVLLRAIVEDPEQPVSQLPLLTEAERHRILVEWNDTQTPYPQDRCVHELFEEQAAKSPDVVAVIFEEEEVSYRELNTRANRLAHQLRALGVGPEVLVGLFVERSVEIIVGLLAILKAGGAYVPLDPEYPEERLAFMVEDADLKVLLCHEATRERLPACAARILDVDAEAKATAIFGENSENPVQIARPENLAYVMYTSGSTGKPKGVCVEHGNIVRLVRNTNYVALDKHQVFLQAAPISFDAATFELWGSLLNGARLVVPSPGQLSLEELGNYLRRHKVTTLWLTAGLFSLMVEHRPDDLAGLRQLLAGGDVLLPEHVTKALRALENGTLINGYGPTENTTFTACHVIPPDVDATRPIPIGIPISNTQIYILDAHMNLVPVGVSGELYAGGAGVARGYLNRPELTAERFTPDPFSDDPQARLYRTGDLCRWLPDGTIEFLGRIDTQVKIRGFRIECGEVENSLLSYPDVREAVVDTRGEGADKQLVAWVVAKDVGAIHESPLRDELRTHLRTGLPDWMVPSVFVFVDALPLTPSGKIDRRALPVPEASDLPGMEYVAPISPTEELLAGLWATVLKREPIGRFDNFFDLGGHSLLATQLISRIRDSFDLELPVRMVFEHPELSALAGAISSSRQGMPGPSARDGNKQLPPIEAQPVDAPKPLSFAQQRLWFLDRFEAGGTATYNIPIAVRLEGAMDIHALQSSLHWMVERHESLRMAFPERDGEAEVIVLSAADFEFPIHDLHYLSLAEQRLQQCINENSIRPFDLAKGPLFRAEILQLGEEAGKAVHVLLVNMHHIISDGWSIGVFVREWRDAYIAFAGGHRPTLAPLPVQYSDYASWQRRWLQGEVLEQQSNYWREVLSGIPALLELPTDYPRPAQLNYRGSHYSHPLPADITAEIKDLSRERGVTLFMKLLAAFDVLLSRYSGQDDVCVGSPIANRTHTHTENLIGFFVNTLVLRTRLNPEQGFRALLQQIRQICLGAYAHQDIPFETLVEQLNPARSLSYSPLFQVMLVLQNNAPLEMELPELTITSLAQDYPIAKFDLTLFVEEQNGQLHCTWEYATSLFAEDTIRRMGEHLEVLLRGIVAEPETPISQLPLLTEAERHRILEWNDTAVPYPQDRCVHELFEEQAAKSPDAVAVIFEDEKVSYGELNARANHLAHRLRRLDVGPEVLVGIFVERSVEMVVGLLAILKSGGAYVPLDPEYPLERLAFMAEDADLKVLLCHGATKERVPECAAAILDMDEDAEGIAGENSENPAQLAEGNNLAYVIYTSGSTGKPKGVMIEHRNLSSYVQTFIDLYGVCKADRILQSTPISFDASIRELFPLICSGGQIVVCRNPKELDILFDDVLSHRVSLLCISPQVTDYCNTRADELVSSASLRILISRGDVLLPSYIENLCGKTFSLYNAYGPTETIANCLHFRIEQPSAFGIPIGRPISNTQAYILDSHMQPAPIGVGGELYIGGADVARGYLNRPELTAERFILDPFSDDPDARLYRTGDSCRWLPDGNIEFLGRIDTQVKIRGFRIECGEVENALLSHPDVREAVVDVRGEGAEKQLVAWVVGADDVAGATDVGATGRSPLWDVLRTHLRGMLPEWMVPTRFVFVDTLPLTPSGKIDRRALPVPDASEFYTSGGYVAPRNPIEQTLADVWRELLGIEKPGIHDNFFDFGGHSLLATRLVSRIRAECSVEIPLRVIFERQTIKEVADYVNASLLNTEPKDVLLREDEEEFEI